MNTCDNILSSTLVKLLRVVASIALCSLAFFLVSCDRSNKHSGESLPAIHLDTPWDVSELFKAPQYRWVDTQSPVHALIYQGLDYKGNLVDVFAYYSTPGVYFHKPETDKDLPGIVLVHGGWGRADHQWVAMWAKRGYAAIAMDLDGKGPDQSRMVNAGPPEKTYLTADWNYHAVAKIILAHSLIRSFQEVDETRTGITGISVGGHLTMTVLGLDTRFAAAVPVYGCGYLHEIDQWNRSDLYTKLSEEEKCAWATLYDPSNYLNYATTPVLFIAGTNDSYYPLNTLVQTYLRYKGPRQYRIHPVTPHSYAHGATFPEVGIFMDQKLRNGAPLPVLHKPRIDGRKVNVEVLSTTQLTDSQIHYTTDTGSYVERSWSSESAEIKKTKVIAELPPQSPTAWFITVTDERGAMASTEVIVSK